MATNYPDFQSALRNQMHESAIISNAPPPPPPRNSYQSVMVSVALAIGAVIILRVVIRKFAEIKANRKLSQSQPKPQQEVSASPSADKVPDKDNVNATE